MWLRFETDGDFGWDYFLAEKLGRTVGEIRRIPLEEWIGWTVYYGRDAQRKELDRLKAGG